MKVVVIGATGTIGHAVADALHKRGHEVVRASRKSSPPIDIEDAGSVRAFFEQTRDVDAVVACAGEGAWGPLSKLGDDDFAFLGTGTGAKAEESLEDLVRGEVSRGLDAADGEVYRRIIERVERPLIESALVRTAGNQIRAAALLGINRNTLRKKITQLGIQLPGRA